MRGVTFVKDKTGLTSDYHTHSHPSGVRGSHMHRSVRIICAYLHDNPSLCSLDIVDNLKTQLHSLIFLFNETVSFE